MEENLDSDSSELRSWIIFLPHPGQHLRQCCGYGIVVYGSGSCFRSYMNFPYMLDINFYLCIPALQVWLGYYQQNYDEIPISFLGEYFF